MALREATYMRWKKSVLKKLKELNALCGVDACVIIYGEFEQEPVVWASKKEAQCMMVRFKLTPEAELENECMENLEMEMIIISKQCLDGEVDLEDLSLQYLEDLKGLLDRAWKHTDERIQTLDFKKNEKEWSD